jgi:hypothetical protein
MTFITEIVHSTLTFICNQKRPWIAKAILSKMSNTGGITIPDFKLYYRAIAIKIAWYWYKNQHEYQCNRTEFPDMNTCSYAQLIFDKCAENIRWRKDSLFNKYWWKNCITACIKLKLHFCHPVQVSTQSGLRTLISTWNIEASPGKSRKYTGSNGPRQYFLSRTQVAQELRESIDKGTTWN